MIQPASILNIKNQAFILILMSGIFFGTIPIFSKLLDQLHISSSLQIFVRFALSLIILYIFIIVTRQQRTIIPDKKDGLIFVIYGFFISMSFFTYLTSISLGTPVAQATFLTYSQPIFVILLGKLILNEMITKNKCIALILSITGIICILQMWNIGQFSFDNYLIGNILALLNGLFYASFIITSRYVRMEKTYNYILITFWSFLFGLLWLIPCWGLTWLLIPNENMSGINLSFTMSIWALLVGLVIFGTIIPYLLLNKGLTALQASHASILLLIEPISVVFMSIFILQEIPNVWELCGGVLILSSIVIIAKTAQ